MGFRLKIDPEWNVIKQIKEHINADPTLKEQGQDFREATLLAAIELIENALKYSDHEEGQSVEFDLSMDDGYCEIRVTNRVRNEEHRAALKEVMERIEDADPFELYVQRLETLKEHPDGFSRMGLIRIVYEGEFSLSANIAGDTVTMIARRAVPGLTAAMETQG